MYCATNQFTELSCCGPHNKPPGVRGLGKHYHIHFNPKLGHGTCEINHIPFYVCNQCTYMIDQSWTPSVSENQQQLYQPAKDCTYWPILGYYNNCNIIQLSHKAKSF